MESLSANKFKVFCFTLALTLPPLACAAEFGDDLVPLDLVEDITGGVVLDGVPPGFPLPSVPFPRNIDFRFLGGQSYSISSQLYLRTGNADELIGALVYAYTASGWTDLSSPIGWLPENSSTTGRMLANLCHDELGTLTIQNTGSAGDETRVRVSLVPSSLFLGSGDLSCAELQAYVSGGYPSGLFSYFQTLMPRLQAPGDSLNPSPTDGLFRGISSIGSAFQSTTFQSSEQRTIEVPASSSSALFADYADQLEAQSWLIDNYVTGSGSSVSIWFKNAPPPEIPGIDSPPALDLTGILTIIDNGNDTYRIEFRMYSD